MAEKIGMIGCGNMGEAILLSCRGHFRFDVAEKSAKRQQYLNRQYNIKTKDLARVVRECSILVLAVKPQDFDDILGSLKVLVSAKHLIISIAAGITTKYIEERIGSRTRVIRAMPNLPALAGQSVTAVTQGRQATKNDLTIACKIFNHIGKTLAVKENLMNAVTATSGSGPGYVYFLMEQMIAAAQKIGLSEKMATDLVVETFSGSLYLLKTKKESPKALREKVTSKGGTTQAALDVFTGQKTGLIFDKALKAAVVRAEKLSRR
ncbi:MAG: pyrroline-5-carboxylate reductase [Candidatus Omnitrophota bacterium]